MNRIVLVRSSKRHLSLLFTRKRCFLVDLKRVILPRLIFSHNIWKPTRRCSHIHIHILPWLFLIFCHVIECLIIFIWRLAKLILLIYFSIRQFQPLLHLFQVHFELINLMGLFLRHFVVILYRRLKLSPNIELFCRQHLLLTYQISLHHSMRTVICTLSNKIHQLMSNSL